MLWPTVVIAALAVGTLTNAAIHEIESGSSVAFIVETFPSTIKGCYLDTPSNTTLEFKPNDSSNDKYALREDTLFSQCSVTINYVDGDDNGVWRLHSLSDTGVVNEVVHEIKVHGVEITQSPEENVTTERPDDLITTSEPSDDFITTTTEKGTIIEILDHIAFETIIGEQIKVNFTHTGFRETETCTVFTPDGKEHHIHKDLQLNGIQAVEDHTITCGIIITVQHGFEGEWMLKTKEYVLGSDVDERLLPFSIGIKEEDKTTTTTSLIHTLKLNEAVNMEVGPEDVVYCKIYRSHSGEVLYEGHDRCQIVVARVNSELAGEWLVRYGLEGKVIMHNDVLHITVDSKPVVETEVLSVKPSVYLSCSVVTTFEPKLCRFTDPNGKSFISAPGASEEGYNFYGNGTTSDGNVYTHNCGLEITSPSTYDLGMWSCTIDTDEENYYGFLTVLCPWAMQDPTVAAQVVAEPVLTAETKQVTATEMEPVTMRCHVKSVIRYCYFRMGNGVTYTVFPGVSSDNYEYVGAGFDAGECGVQFKSLSSMDSGAWSCHVGFMDAEEPEQKAGIDVHVEPEFIATQIMDERSGALNLFGIVHKPLDYCRFVRIDGFGFTSDTVPSEYISATSLSEGVCGLTIRNPSILERHEWTIAAKITGETGEISDSTGHSLHFAHHNNVGGLIVMYYILMFLGLFMIIFGILMMKKEPRKWTMERANGIRNSFRRQPLHIVTEKPVNNV